LKEYGIDETMPIYSGGLGILSGDHLKSASDLGIPLVAVGLLYKNGYFNQKINGYGDQETEYKKIESEIRNEKVYIYKSVTETRVFRKEYLSGRGKSDASI
jgi:glucan phosphorylase